MPVPAPRLPRVLLELSRAVTAAANALRQGPIDDLVDELFLIARINRTAVVARHTRDAAVYLTRQ